jgi:hypothetical protein
MVVERSGVKYETYLKNMELKEPNSYIMRSNVDIK